MILGDESETRESAKGHGREKGCQKSAGGGRWLQKADCLGAPRQDEGAPADNSDYSYNATTRNLRTVDIKQKRDGCTREEGRSEWCDGDLSLTWLFITTRRNHSLGRISIIHCEPMPISIHVFLFFRRRSHVALSRRSPIFSSFLVSVEPLVDRCLCVIHYRCHSARCRATTSGTGNLDAAIYFSGQDMNTHRVLGLKYQRDGATLHKKVQLREKNGWIERLTRQKYNQTKLGKKQKEDLIRWAKTFRMSTSDLEVILSMKEWRSTKARKPNRGFKNEGNPAFLHVR